MTAVNWSAIDRRSLLGRALRLGLVLVPRNSVRRIRRGGAQGMRWVAGATTHGCWLGTYELDKQAALARFLRPGMIAYDLGAQAGFYTLIMARAVGPSGAVVAFEPSADSVPLLLRHLRLNNLTNVRVVAAAVSDRCGLDGFTIGRNRTENSLVAPDGAELMINTITLDSAGLPPPNLIKMDVEGAEGAVLRGAQRMLERHRPVVFVALHSAEQKKFCGDLLRSLRYDLFDLAGNRIAGTPRIDEIYATAS
jgi:FkbM family methyltransferase